MPRPCFRSTKQQIEEIIRVDHAGEYGAQRIYQGQLECCKSHSDYFIIKEMLAQEEVHLRYFENEMIDRSVRPSVLLPLWHFGGWLLGAISMFCDGFKGAMLVTSAVEDVIVAHYQNQIDALEHVDDEQILRQKISEFKKDEEDHLHTATLNDKASILGCAMDYIATLSIKTLCRFCIFLSRYC